MDRSGQHLMTFSALFCFVLAAALMISSLTSARRLPGTLELQDAPIELASTARRF